MINTQIESIISQRRSRVPELELKKASLDNLEISLESLRTFITRNMERVLPEKQPRCEEFKSALANLVNDCRTQQAELGKLVVRFQRERVNVGIVGMARQGKSTLLKSLSGLQDDVIPTGKTFTTGAASKIYNDPSVLKGEEFAEITFHTPATFLRDCVHPLWSEKDGVLLGIISQPSSLDEFEHLSIPDFGKDPRNAKATILLDELREIQSELSAFRSFLGAPKQHASRMEIRSYVAQCDANDKRLSTWRAVKQAEIFCAFPNTEVEKVALLDTPGLGQITVGLEAYVKEVMGSEMDLAVMVVNPSPEGPVITEPFANLYSLLDRSLEDLRLDKWAALAINKTPNNSNVLHLFDEDLAKKPALRFDAGKMHVSCISPDETQAFFSDCLAYIATNCARLDELYLKSRLQSLTEIRKRVSKLYNDIRNIFPPQEENWQQEDTFFDDEFTRVWRGEIGPALRSLVKEYESAIKVNLVNDEIQNALKELEDKINSTEQAFDSQQSKDRIPTPAEIEGFPEGLQIWSGNQAQSLLTRLLGIFGELDKPLKESYRRIREKFWNGFIRNSDEGNLGCAPEIQEIGKMEIDDRIKELSLLFQNLPNSKQLADYFEKASSIYPSYDTFLKYEIRQHLNPLAENSDEYKEMYVLPFLKSAQNARDALINAWRVASQDALEMLRNGFAKKLRLAEFAYVEEMVNNLLLLDGSEQAKVRVQRLFGRFRRKIWPSHYKGVEGDLRFQSELEEHLNRVSQAINGFAH